MTALLMDDFVNLNNWSNLGGFSISPAGWAYNPGNPFSTNYIYRAQGTAVFVETKAYIDNANDWMMLKIDTSTSNMYNTSASDGAGIICYASGTINSYIGGTLTYSGWATNNVYNVTAPRASGTAVVLGIYHRSSTSYSLYVNQVLIGNVVTSQATTGVNVACTGYNSNGAHFDYMAMYDHVPSRYEPRNTVSSLVGSG